MYGHFSIHTNLCKIKQTKWNRPKLVYFILHRLVCRVSYYVWLQILLTSVKSSKIMNTYYQKNLEIREVFVVLIQILGKFNSSYLLYILEEDEKSMDLFLILLCFWTSKFDEQTKNTYLICHMFGHCIR
jgi:hypothetical protein